MLLTRAPDVAQGISPAQALVIARERFGNLCGGGILPKHATGVPVDLADIARALAFLSRCGKTAVPTVHSFDLRRMIDVQLGAVICAATALGFATHSWLDITEFAPHAMVAVDAADVARVARLELTI
jgi:hypothetical protein